MGNLLDNAINYFAPKWGSQRLQYRELGKIVSSYGGSVANRTSTGWSSTAGQSYIARQQQETYQITRMRDRAQELERNNPIADGLLSRAVENIVAQGFELQATTQDHEWNALAESLWNDWTATADATGLSWLEHQRLVVRSHLRDGDVGSILLIDGRVQAVEANDIVSPNGSSNGLIVDGVEVSDIGRPTAFYINSFDDKGKAKSVKVNASDFVFFPRLKRLRQIRGEPVFAQTFNLLDQIDGYLEAVVVAARIAACFGLAITKQNSQQWLNNQTDVTANNNGKNQRQIQIEPGMIPTLEPGEDIKAIQPAQPQQSFPDNLVALLRLTGLTLGMPLELVLLDFSRTNFSSARASMLQAYRSFKTLQEIFDNRYLTRIYNWRISKFIKEGKLPDRPDAWNHRFVAPTWAYLDPMREALAMQMNIDMGTETLSSALLSQGKDFETWVATRKRELEAMEAANIPLVHGSAVQPYDNSTQPIVINQGEGQ